MNDTKQACLSIHFPISPITREDLVLIVPSHHPLAAKQSVALTETLVYPQIYFSHGSGMRDVVDHLFSQIHAPVWERNLYMIHDRQAFMPPAVRNFREFVLKECKYNGKPD